MVARSDFEDFFLLLLMVILCYPLILMLQRS